MGVFFFGYLITAVLFGGGFLCLSREFKAGDDHAEALEKSRISRNASENRCVCCGSVIPEGRQVCPICEMTVSMKGG